MKTLANLPDGRLVRGLFLALLNLALLAGEAPEVEAGLNQELRCRAGVERRSIRYVERSQVARQKCLRRVFRGRLSSTTDCIYGLGGQVLQRRLEKLRARVSRLIPRRCSNADLAALGYPGPCIDERPPFDVGDLQRCLIEGQDARIAALLEKEYPPAQLLPANYVFCVNGVGRRAAQMIRTEMRARQECLFSSGINALSDEHCREQIPPYGDGTGHGRTDRRIMGAYTALLAGVPEACTGVNVDFLGYDDHCEDPTGGRFNTFDLKVCLFDSHRELVQDIIEVSFPAEATCGNGEREDQEACDDGNASENDGCLNDCTLARCGDGRIHAGVEQCDDGNAVDEDACLNDCTSNSCGDGHIYPGVEQCDDGNPINSDACLDTCEVAACGDGVVCLALQCVSGPEGGAEDCDDGNQLPNDGCSARCGVEFCGDGIVNNGTEECDEGAGNGIGPNQCRLGSCKSPSCGDGVIDDADPYLEQCDPPDGTNCSDTCKSLSCGDGILDDGEQCDNGPANSDTAPNACRENCTNSRCGDGVIDSGEACDDGNTSNTDGCLSTCQENVCGDGILQIGAEQCDDGNTTNSDTCLNNCTGARCGDGVVCLASSCTTGPENRAEECDDGNTASDDGCASTCQVEFCGDGIVNNGEQCDGSAEPCGADSLCTLSCRCQSDDVCPGSGELMLLAGYGAECSSGDECPTGRCENGRCRSETRLDSGWTGIAHGSDITDEVRLRGFLDCGTDFPCGECTLAGIDPSLGNCRCANDNRQHCFLPFENDNESCGGDLCHCYLGPPLALSSGNTPACIVNRLREDVTGTANVDDGSGVASTKLAAVAYLGESTIEPCPYCDGDTIPGDGVRDGTCVLGPNRGQSCDVDGINRSFPAPGGGGHSLDCFPEPGKNVSGAGLVIDFTQTTGDVELGVSGDIPCRVQVISVSCFCAMCSDDPSVPCSSDADCAVIGAGTCSSFGTASSPAGTNQCQGTGQVCVDLGDGNAECEIGQDLLCDAVLKSNGEGIYNCLSNADCQESIIGIDAGTCSLTKKRACFTDPIQASGQADPNLPIGAGTFCIGPTSNPGLNTVAGLPGPARILNQVQSTLFCANDPSKIYTPGAGGCE